MTVQLAYAASQLGNAAEALGTYEVHFSSLSATLPSHSRKSAQGSTPPDSMKECSVQGMMSGDAQDEAVRAVATNNWIADTVRSEAEGLTKKFAAEFLKRLETLFEKVWMMLAHAAYEEAAHSILHDIPCAAWYLAQ